MNGIRKSLLACIGGLDFKSKWHFWYFNLRYPRATYKGLMWIKSALESMEEVLLFDDDIENVLLKDFPRIVEDNPIPAKLLQDALGDDNNVA